MSTQLFTSTSTAALGYSVSQETVVLCDGSLAVIAYDGSVGHLYQVTSPTSSPSTTAITTFNSGATPTVSSLHVLNNGTTTSDVWVVYASNSSTTGDLYVAHATYTASGASWSWDNTGTKLTTGAAFIVASVAWTGTYLITLYRHDTASTVVYANATTTKNGSSGWGTEYQLGSTSGGQTHGYGTLLHDATNGCTLAVYTNPTNTAGQDTVHARVIADGTAPTSQANWSSEATLSGNINVGAANLTATIDTANKKLHTAWIDTATSPNPKYCVSTYTTSAVSAGTAFSITGGGGTTASGPTLALDVASPPTVYLFWAGAAPAAASDISYVTIASPYASGNVSAVTNLTNASTNDYVYPQAPHQAPVSGYVPLVYQKSATSPYGVILDTSVSASSGTTSYNVGGAIVSGAKLAATISSPSASVGGAIKSSAKLAVTAVAVLSVAASVVSHATLAASLAGGTGIATLAVSTKSQTWSGGPTGSPGTETDVTSTDATGSGWAVGLIPSYGGMPISSWYEVDNSVVGANQTSLTTSTPDGHIHWLEQSSGSVFAGSEDKPFTMTELAPTGTSFRRYYQCSFGPDANGFNWVGYACIYPGDPGFIAYRFDCINPNGTAITLSSSDAIEIALLGGMQQSDSTWSATNGYYSTLAAGATPTAWPTASGTGNLVNADPDYVYITPAVGSSVKIGQMTVKKTAMTAMSPAWSSVQIAALVNTNRLKIKIQGNLTGNSFPASTTSTFYALNVLRRSLTSADAYAIAADYINPGTPSVTTGSFTSFSYDERAYVFAASLNRLGATLDLTPTHVSVRYKPVVKVTNWTAAAPNLTWGGSALTAGADYQYTVDSTNHVLYIQLYFDVVTSGAVSGQKNNAALSVAAPATSVAGSIVDHGALAATVIAVTPVAGSIVSHAKLATTIVPILPVSGAVVSHAKLAVNVIAVPVTGAVVSHAKLAATVIAATPVAGAVVSHAKLAATVIAVTSLSQAAITSHAKLGASTSAAAAISPSPIVSHAKLAATVIAVTALSQAAVVSHAHLAATAVAQTPVRPAPIISHAKLSASTTAGVALSQAAITSHTTFSVTITAVFIATLSVGVATRSGQQGVTARSGQQGAIARDATQTVTMTT